MPNTVNVMLPIGLMNSRTIVVSKITDGIKIREATIIDNRTLTIRRGGHFSFTCNDAKELIGEYDFEIEGDYLYLTRAVGKV